MQEEDDQEEREYEEEDKQSSENFYLKETVELFGETINLLNSLGRLN
jgi:hypothetical protein